MKKRKFFLVLIGFLFSNTVNATEVSDYYVNQNKISITEQEFITLRELGFTDKQIAEMDYVEFNKNKDLDAELVSVNTKYIKTTIVYECKNHNTSTMSLNNPIKELDINTLINNNVLSVKSKTSVEVTKEEYENANDENIYMTTDVNPSIVDTSYKKLTTSISRNGNYYRLKNDLVWKKMPNVRSYDVFGIRNNYAMSPVSGSQYSKLSYTILNNCYGTSSSNYDVYGTSSSRWKKENDGYGLSFKLPVNTTQSYSWGGLGQSTQCPCINPPGFGNTVIRTNEVVALSSYMYFDVVKIGSGTINTIDAYGSYQHATSTISSSVSLSFGIEANGLGAVLQFSSDYNNKFDGMQGTHAQVLNANW